MSSTTEAIKSYVLQRAEVPEGIRPAMIRSLQARAMLSASRELSLAANALRSLSEAADMYADAFNSDALQRIVPSAARGENDADPDAAEGWKTRAKMLRRKSKNYRFYDEQGECYRIDIDSNLRHADAYVQTLMRGADGDVWVVPENLRGEFMWEEARPYDRDNAHHPEVRSAAEKLKGDRLQQLAERIREHEDAGHTYAVLRESLPHHAQGSEGAETSLSALLEVTSSQVDDSFFQAWSAVLSLDPGETATLPGELCIMRIQ